MVSLKGQGDEVSQESREGYSGRRGCWKGAVAFSLGTSQSTASPPPTGRELERLSPPALLFPAGTCCGLDSARTPKLRKRNWHGSYRSAPRDRASGEERGDLEGQVDYSAD